MKRFLLSFFMVAAAVPALVTATISKKEKYACSFADTLKVAALPGPDTSEMKYLALGDSYTIGQCVKADERYPAQVVQLLRQEGIKMKDPGYIATSGWTTKNLITAINSRHPQPNYDAVSLLIGVNDQYQGMDTGGYRARFTVLLNKAIDLAGGRRRRVFVLSIPDYSVTPFVFAEYKQSVRSELNQFNAINKQIALRYKVSYIDITPFSREAETNPSLIARDGLHFSGLQYKKWSDKLEPLMKLAFKY